MGIKEKIKEKLIGLFFVDADEMTEEAAEESRKDDRSTIKLFGLAFLINTVIIIILFLKGEFDIIDLFELGLLIITLVLGIFTLFIDRISN